MFEINNIREINKGALKAVGDVRIPSLKMNLKEVKFFDKGDSRWVTLPSKEFVNELNERKYIELVTFDTPAMKTRFCEQILELFLNYYNKDKDETDLPF